MTPQCDGPRARYLVSWISSSIWHASTVRRVHHKSPAGWPLCPRHNNAPTGRVRTWGAGEEARHVGLQPQEPGPHPCRFGRSRRSCFSRTPTTLKARSSRSRMGPSGRGGLFACAAKANTQPPGAHLPFLPSLSLAETSERGWPTHMHPRADALWCACACVSVSTFICVICVRKGNTETRSLGRLGAAARKQRREKILVGRTEVLARPIPGSMSWRAPRDTLARLSCGWASR